MIQPCAMGTAPAFDKRVKRRVTGPEHPFFAVCLPGLEDVCENEITVLFPENRTVRRIQGGVEFTGRLTDGYLANLQLGSCSRILMRVGSFRAENFTAFEKKTAAVDWELFLPPETIPDCRVSVHNCRLYHSDALARRTAASIRTRLDLSGRPPAVQPQTVYIRGDRDRFTVSLDSSGENLYKRGIKQQVTAAPIRETIARSILVRAGYRPGDRLVDPMCGSGTFSLEAAMMQSRIPPGFYRRFACEHWPAFSEKQFQYLKNRIKDNFSFPDSPLIWASDIDRQAVETVEQNVKSLPFPAQIQTRTADFFSLTPEKTGLPPGVIVLNPPYGHRIRTDSGLRTFYRAVGRKLRLDFPGWKTGVVIPSKTLARCLKIPLTLTPVFHGGLNIFIGTGRIQTG